VHVQRRAVQGRGGGGGRSGLDDGGHFLKETSWFESKLIADFAMPGG
jgi:hypothetical protein